MPKNDHFDALNETQFKTTDLNRREFAEICKNRGSTIRPDSHALKTKEPLAHKDGSLIAISLLS